MGHIDVDIRMMVESGRGANMIQGSISFDDEDIDNYPEIASGLHYPPSRRGD